MKFFLIAAAIFLLTITVAGLFLFLEKNNETEISPQNDFAPLTINKIEKDFDPELIDWEEATGNALWSKRDSQGAAVYKDKMWLLGGLNGNDFVIKKGVVEYWKAPHYSDVWVSENGNDWKLVTEKAAWGGRRSVQVVDFKNKLWLMGGWGPNVGYKNDIWSSEDGEQWKQEISSAAWPPREGHSIVFFDNKLWLIGGVRYDKRETKNDVWYSEDGINWTEAISAAPWSPRWDHAVAVFQNKIWLIGGMDLNDNIFNDVWYSENGVNWVLATNNPGFKERQGHSVVVFKNKLWVIGRLDNKEIGDENDVWYSEDGVNWKKTKNNPLWLGREDFSAVVFKDKIWVAGGMDNNWVWNNDVWHSSY